MFLSLYPTTRDYFLWWIDTRTGMIRLESSRFSKLSSVITFQNELLYWLIGILTRCLTTKQRMTSVHHWLTESCLPKLLSQFIKVFLMLGKVWLAENVFVRGHYLVFTDCCQTAMPDGSFYFLILTLIIVFLTFIPFLTSILKQICWFSNAMISVLQKVITNNFHDNI